MLLKQALGATSDLALLDKLTDPSRSMRPTTASRKSTESARTLKLQYGSDRMYELGRKNRSRQMQRVYEVAEEQREGLRVQKNNNTYVSHSNKTQEILRKKKVP